jgi:hypothetical protein
LYQTISVIILKCVAVLGAGVILSALPRLFHITLFFEFCGGRLIYLAPRLKNTFGEKNLKKKNFCTRADEKTEKTDQNLPFFLNISGSVKYFQPDV